LNRAAPAPGDPVPLPGQQSPGNLLAVDGQLVVQSTTGLASFGAAREDKKDAK